MIMKKYEIEMSQNICRHCYFNFNNPNFIAYEEFDSRRV
jgi:hypothetical protein